MTRMDAAAAADLERQYRELGFVLARLRAVRSTLLPSPGDWAGVARGAYDLALAGLAHTLDSAIVSVDRAQRHTGIAVGEVVDG